MPDPVTIAKVRKTVKREVIPGQVPGIPSVTRQSNLIPSAVGPARLSAGLQGNIPAGSLLPGYVTVTQGFRPGHTALDLAGPVGTKIYAPETLRITQAGRGPWGIDVIGINPATGNRFTFGHFEAVAPGLSVGQVVPAGTLLGYEGSTFTPPGWSSGPHLHLQENLPSGAAVMPSAQDILNTFVTGLSVPTAPVPAMTYSGNVAAPAVNTSMLGNNPAVTASQETEAQVSQAVNAGTGTTSAGPLNTFSGTILEKGSFLTSHTPADFMLIGMGLLLFLFGAVLFYGLVINKEFGRELDVINKTSDTVKNATEAVGPIIGAGG